MANENTKNQAVANDSSEIAVRRAKLAALREGGRDPFEVTKFDRDSCATGIKADFDSLQGRECRIAGRIVSKRVMGKASFFHIQDATGEIQCYARRDVMGEEPYMLYRKSFDIGDIVGVVGEIFRTEAGEISVKCHEITLLSKSLQAFPEKFHGLKDKDLRYRQRYVDLIVNPEVR